MTADYEKSLEEENEKLRLQLAKVEEDYDTLDKAYKLRCGPTVTLTEKDISTGLGYSRGYAISSNGIPNTYDITSIPPNTVISSPGYRITDTHFKFISDSYEEYKEFKKAGLWKKIKMIFFTKRT